MSADHRVKVGVAAIVQTGSHLLMLRRSAMASHGEETWSVPGGWVDWGEHPRLAVVRELEEETGLIGSAKERPHAVVANTYEDKGLHVVCLFYDVIVGSDRVENREPDKHDFVGWVPFGGIRDKTPRFAPFETLMSGPDAL